MLPKVEIIIPTYNRAHVVRQAIESVLDQNYSNLFILIIDDGSTDDTAALLSAHSSNPRVRSVLHQRNRGVTAAKNTGLDNLSEDTVYFGILDSDDVLAPGAIQALVNEFARLKDSVSQVFGLCIDSRTGHVTGSFEQHEGLVCYEDALCGRFYGEFWQLIRRNLISDLRFEARAAGGEGLVWHALFKMSPGYVTTTVARVYNQSGSDRVSLERYDPVTSRKKMWVYLAYLNDFGRDLRRLCPERHALFLLEGAKWAILAGERRMAISLLSEATISRSSLKQWIRTLIQLAIPLPLLRSIREGRTVNGSQRA